MAGARRSLAGWNSQADLYDAGDIQPVIDYVATGQRQITYLVNAAGNFKPADLLEHGSEDYSAYLDLKLPLSVSRRQLYLAWVPS